MNDLVVSENKSIVADMASRFSMESANFERTLRATVFPNNGTKEQFAAFLMVARQYNLNPITREIYAFSGRGGGVVPIVSIDGWMNLINSHPQFDGMDFQETHDDKGELISTTCRIHRKDRAHPITVTEYLGECYRATDPWKMKHRMLRHKAAIQAARYAFGFAGIHDEDEGRVIANARPVEAVVELPKELPPVARDVNILMAEGDQATEWGASAVDAFVKSLNAIERKSIGEIQIAEWLKATATSTEEDAA